ncbi:S-adenosyl methyltransferase [Actinomadura pelletieri DSM 43383]|uniref:S-adenosyl methyltransferase n=1 Tax=Actinomadura pelletieri DSM 43383 TaxID=1120940 RepID=A0A495QBM1_9ACTN|nr:SAM-dependent methyltransferase [Actinomadura pelletieri]RKS69085.1 S-adenosyl methyltransferase [Actinomadura pelletieri DSM 43383]
MGEVGPTPPSGVDTAVPNVARMYDYYLGGKDNYAADREAAEKVIAAMPGSRIGARANRAFLMRAVRYLVGEAGVTQFLDIGAGLPTQSNVHEVALSVNPAARVVYVDWDPTVCAHSRALIRNPRQVGVVEGDLRCPDAVLRHETTRALLDFDRPIAVMMVSILHFIADSDDPPSLVARYRDATAPGSHLVVSHLTGDLLEKAVPEETERAKEVYRRTASPVHLRSHERIRELFKGYDLVSPGLSWLTDWRPDEPTPDGSTVVRLDERRGAPVEEAPGYGGRIPAYAGVGRRS